MQLSEKIRIIRKARGYSQEEFGDRLKKISPEGISRQSISDWENGNSEPKLDNIRDIATVLNVSFDTLLDDSIDLSDENVLNVSLKHLNKATKDKVNSSYRYRIYEYSITWKDYFRVCLYFTFAIVGIVLLIVGIANLKSNNTNALFFIGLFMTSIVLAMVALPIDWIKRIKLGGRFNSFGTLSGTHFVVIGLSDDKHDNTIYVPVGEIEKMELAPGANDRHGSVVVHIKGRSKPLITNDIVNPKELIKEFNNLEFLSDF